MYSIYYSATLYDDGERRDKFECGVLTGVNNYVDAMKKIESYYGDTLEKIEIELFDTEFMVFPCDKGPMIHQILEGNAF